MADGIPTRTQSLTRAQIAEFFGPNPRAIKLIENLLGDVAGTLPDAIVEVDLASRYSLQAADGSKSTAQRAERMAIEAESLLLTCRANSTAIDELRRAVADLQAQLQDMQFLRSTVESLRRDLEDLRAITQGT